MERRVHRIDRVRSNKATRNNKILTRRSVDIGTKELDSSQSMVIKNQSEVTGGGGEARSADDKSIDERYTPFV